MARYYLRYGTAELPQDTASSSVTWAGARYVDQAVLVGTPNAGSALALDRLVHGRDFGRFALEYGPALLGTMPSLY